MSAIDDVRREYLGRDLNLAAVEPLLNDPADQLLVTLVACGIAHASPP
jgi:hypothetical protein